jgi:methyl-accepting chemotaxis protein
MTVLLCNSFLLVNMLLPGEQRLDISFSTATLIGIVELVLVVGVLYASLRTTHRIAGPIFVISRQLRAFGAGDLTARITLRNTDMFRDEAGEINGGLDQLQARVAEIKTHALELEAIHGKGGDIGPSLANLSASLGHLRTRGEEGLK